MSLLEKLNQNRKSGLKSFAVLIDPDKITPEQAQKLIRLSVESKVDYFFVGGSLITSENFSNLIKQLKSESEIPVVIFPGSNLQIDSSADAILLLSLISGRNPDYLIGQHVIAAPALKRSRLEILPTGYILIDCGRQTTVSYISNTTPVPHDKPDVAACTALAGEMLGLKMIYLDGGSGALKPVSPNIIGKVRSAVEVPLIVGGGINTAEKAQVALRAGADLIVVGNAIEDRPMLLTEIAENIAAFNKTSDLKK